MKTDRLKEVYIGNDYLRCVYDDGSEKIYFEGMDTETIFRFVIMALVWKGYIPLNKIYHEGDTNARD